MKEHSKIFFDSYALAMEAAGEDYLKINERSLARGLDADNEDFGIWLKKAYKKWLVTSDERLDGKTPAEFMFAVGSPDELAEMFVYGSIVCDGELPEAFLNKLRSFGEEAEKLLIKIARGVPACSDSGEESLLASVMAVRVLGEWKSEGSVGPLIDIMYTSGEIDELVYETVRDALIAIGTPSIDKIIDRLEQEHECTAADEYMLMALSELGRRNRSDKVYSCLKNAFLQMPQKAVAADCLAKYGDGRAVPAIRGFLKKYAGQLDKDTFYDLVSAVRRLGGNTDDL